MTLAAITYWMPANAGEWIALIGVLALMGAM